jgi:hypothetical protein
VTSGLGAVVLAGGRTLFRVWAPLLETLEVEITAPEARTRPVMAYYQEWLSLRQQYRLGRTERESVEVLLLRDDDVIVVVRRPHAPANVALVLSFALHSRIVSLPLPGGQWSVLIDSADNRWGGPGSRFARTFTVRQQADVILEPCSALLLLQSAAA